MDNRKYLDIAVQNPRGKLVKAIIEANWNSWLTAYEQYAYADPDADNPIPSAEDTYVQAVWYFGILQSPGVLKVRGSKAETSIYNIFDAWLEDILHREAYKLKTGQQLVPSDARMQRVSAVREK